MTHYSKEFKESVISKMLPPNNVDIARIALVGPLEYAVYLAQQAR